MGPDAKERICADWRMENGETGDGDFGHSTGTKKGCSLCRLMLGLGRWATGKNSQGTLKEGYGPWPWEHCGHPGLRQHRSGSAPRRAWAEALDGVAPVPQGARFGGVSHHGPGTFQKGVGGWRDVAGAFCHPCGLGRGREGMYARPFKVRSGGGVSLGSTFGDVETLARLQQQKSVAPDAPFTESRFFFS